MSKFNEKKFRFSETFTNTDGKSSGSGFIGVFLGLVAGVSFLGAMMGYFFQLPETVSVMGQILALVAASGLLLGVRKISPKIGNQGSEAERKFDRLPYEETEREEAETDRNIKQDVIDAEKG